jgi:hypothetical protein
VTARLLTEDEARAYCGGIDPRKVTAPRRFGRGVRWDREEIDAALDGAWKATKPAESGGEHDQFTAIDQRLTSAARRNS